MNIDTFFKIGSTHQVCQDYVIECNDRLALSDGCSSAPNSDIGARLIAHAVSNYNEDKLPQMVKDLGLPTSCLFATYLSIAKPVQGKDGRSFSSYERYGDGFIAVRNLNGRMNLTEYQFQKNTPYYIAYDILKMNKSFDEVKDNRVICTGYGFNEDFSLDWKLDTSEELYCVKYERNHLFLHDVKWAAILSDGLNSFIDSNMNSVPVEKLVPYLFSFKSFNGEFVKRRMQIAFREFAKLGWKHTDDFSIGVMHYGELQDAQN